MKRIIIFFITLLISFTCFAQSQKEIDYYKNKYFEYKKIGADSALIYIEKVFSSKRPTDLAYAYAAKWHLLVVTKQNFNEKEYLDKVDFYLNQSPEVKENYYDLANIYSIKAQISRSFEKYSKAQSDMLIAENFGELNGDFKQLIRIKSNLSSLLGSLGKKESAIAALKKNIKLIDEKNDGGEYLNEWKIRNTINLGVFYIDMSEEKKKKEYLDSANTIFNNMLSFQLTDHFLATVNSKLGIINNLSGNYEQAIEHYKKAITTYRKLKMLNEIDIISYNLGYNYYKDKKYAEAKNIFLDILRNKKDTIIDKNYLFSHKYLGEIYTYEKNDSAIYYLDKFVLLYSNKTETEKLAIAKSYNAIEKKDLNQEIYTLKEEIKNQHLLYKWFLIIISILVAVFAFFIYFFIKKRKENEHKLNDLLEKLQENKLEDKPKAFSTQKITSENERKIIDGLLKLEKEAYFLKKDFNLHNTAKKIGSNTSYLTTIIKTNKKMSFNDYTNELRINYILKELMVNEKLQNYTIQSLAEVVGYKNGASFSKIFKLKTGVTPFQFIEKIKKENYV